MVIGFLNLVSVDAKERSNIAIFLIIGSTAGDEMCNLYLMFYTEADNADFFTCAGSQQTRNAYSDIADKKLMELDRETSQKTSEGVKKPKSFDAVPPSHRSVSSVFSLNRLSRRKRGMASNTLFIIPDIFCIFPTNFAMATLDLKEMGKFLWEGRENEEKVIKREGQGRDQSGEL